MTHRDVPMVGITAGDPSGIGPEIAVKAAADPRVTAVCTPVLYGPTSDRALSAYRSGAVSGRSGRAAYEAILEATADARAGRIHAIATAPINKAAFAQAGIAARGHTDLLAELCGVADVAMMFWSAPLRVVLATVHIPLARVAVELTSSRLLTVIRLTHAALPHFGFAAPRIGVAGLNPHAGEDGLMGDEEQQVMRPAIGAARTAGMDVTGPFPGDTVFVRAARGEFDAVVAAYHDQGLIPVKLLAFGTAVNVTLGLPIVRTSVDHGTAFDIARTGRADPGSMIEAVLLAAKLAGSRRR